MNLAQALDLAIKQHQAGNLREAELLYRQILQTEPRHVDALHMLGVIAYQVGRHELAVEYIRAALRERPAFAQAYNNLGNAMKDQGKLDEAITHYQQAVRLKPDYALAYNNLGNVLQDQGKLDEAIAHYQQALRLNPDLAEAYNSLGTVSYERSKFDEAAAYFHQALRLMPDSAEAHNNLGTARYEQGKHDDAAASYERALLLKPGNGNYHFNRAVLWLLHGQFEKGWVEYDWRWRSTLQSPRPFSQPLWQGEPLAGRTILLHAEQGIGDTLQLVRYIPLVRAQGSGSVLLECQPPLVRLLTDSCAPDSLSGLGADRVVAQGEPLPSFDVHAPLFSLPRLLGTSSPERIPANIPYLRCDPELILRWRVWLEERENRGGLPLSACSLRIGIVWQGNPNNQKDRWRSVPLERFAVLGEVPGVSLISLQKGPGSEQLRDGSRLNSADFSRSLPLDLGTELTDFADTAAALQNLDLIITVDTALAHLAGALGIAAWVALPLTPDWRWLLQREDSPWYPTLRLFRQQRVGEWDEVFERIAAAVEKRLESGS